MKQPRENGVYVSVAIPTYKRCAYLLDALESVMAQQTDFAYEILVLDNACDRALQAKVEQIAIGHLEKLI